jgi:hypothetical protein
MGWVVSITSRPRFTPGERAPGTHWTGGRVCPRTVLDTEDRRNILCPCRESKPNRPAVQPVVRHYTAWAIPAPLKISSLFNIQLCRIYKKSSRIHYASRHMTILRTDCLHFNNSNVCSFWKSNAIILNWFNNMKMRDMKHCSLSHTKKPFSYIYSGRGKCQERIEVSPAERQAKAYYKAKHQWRPVKSSVSMLTVASFLHRILSA